MPAAKTALALLIAAGALAALPAAADPGRNDNHTYERRWDDGYDRYGRPEQWQGRDYRHDDRRWDYDERRAYRKGYERGRREEYRDDYRYGYGANYGYGPRGGVVFVPLGGYFDYRFNEVVSRHYGLPCQRFGSWRGEWRRPYAVGYALPDHVRWGGVDPGLARVLPRPPAGYTYVSVDRDVLLIAEASRRVIDAIVIASAR